MAKKDFILEVEIEWLTDKKAKLKVKNSPFKTIINLLLPVMLFIVIGLRVTEVDVDCWAWFCGREENLLDVTMNWVLLLLVWLVEPSQNIMQSFLFK